MWCQFYGFVEMNFGNFVTFLNFLIFCGFLDFLGIFREFLEFLDNLQFSRLSECCKIPELIDILVLCDLLFADNYRVPISWELARPQRPVIYFGARFWPRIGGNYRCKFRFIPSITTKKDDFTFLGI
jgi:hypothetical protein